MRLLSARMRAASVLLMEKRMGADNSGASRHQAIKASAVIFKTSLSLLERTSADAVPGRRARFRRTLAGGERSQDGFLAANHQSHPQLAFQNEVYAVIHVALLDDLGPLPHGLRFHELNKALELFVA